jgi:hypothetical protein
LEVLAALAASLEGWLHMSRTCIDVIIREGG